MRDGEKLVLCGEIETYVNDLYNENKFGHVPCEGSAEGCC